MQLGTYTIAQIQSFQIGNLCLLFHIVTAVVLHKTLLYMYVAKVLLYTISLTCLCLICPR